MGKNETLAPGKLLFKYDDKGNKISEVFEEPDGISYTKTWDYTFDNKGNWITCIEKQDGKKPLKMVRVLHYADKPIPNRPVPALNELAKNALNNALQLHKFNSQQPLQPSQLIR